MFSPGKVHYEVGAYTDAMSYGGIGAVHRLVTKLGLPKRIDASLSLLKVHLPYHESDHACLCVARRQVLNLCYNVMCLPAPCLARQAGGGTRLEDIERLRSDGAYMNALGAKLIPDPTTACLRADTHRQAGDYCRRFSERDIVELMACINAVRSSLWASRGRKLLGDITYIDVDGTNVPTYGKRKRGMDISYQGIWGYHPLVISLSNTKEVLFLVNRPGNVPSHTGAAQWIDAAIDLVQPHAKRICVRGDTDFFLTRHLDRWAKSVDFIFGMDANAAMRSRADRPR